MGEKITVTESQRKRRRRRRRPRPRVGLLTPNQMADRFIQLSKQWHLLAREEMAATGTNDPPSRVGVKQYDAWAKGTFKSPADVLMQPDTLKRFDEWRIVYGAHRTRVAGILNREPASMSLEQFDRYRGSFFGAMPWWGWLVAAGIAYLLIKELGSYRK